MIQLLLRTTLWCLEEYCVKKIKLLFIQFKTVCENRFVNIRSTVLGLNGFFNHNHYLNFFIAYRKFVMILNFSWKDIRDSMSNRENLVTVGYWQPPPISLYIEDFSSKLYQTIKISTINTPASSISGKINSVFYRFMG